MLNQETRGIWKYSKWLPPVEPLFQLSLGEGHTSLLKLNSFYVKCEFENPTGSVKDRGFAFQVSIVKKSGITHAVLSSSGNAAISASAYCKLGYIDLDIFISEHINPGKKEILIRNKTNIHTTLKPISSASQFAMKNNVFNLRQSTDPNAIYGYTTLAYELYEADAEIDAIFIPVSSGTMFEGIALGCQKLGVRPALHAVQTESVHPIASHFDTQYKEARRSLADGIVARYTVREDSIINYVRLSKGYGWVISDRDMEKAFQRLKNQKVTSSYEGAACVAALWKADQEGYHYRKPVCILSGTFYP